MSTFGQRKYCAVYEDGNIFFVLKNLPLESHRKTAVVAVFGGVPSPAGLPGGKLWVLESEPVLLFCRVCVVPSRVLLSSRLALT